MNIKKWDRNLDELYNLIKKPWGMYYPNFTNFNYDINYFNWFLEYPGNIDVDHFVYYQDKKMIAFVGLNKRNYKFKGIVNKGYYISLLTIDPDYENQSIGKIFMSEVLKKVLEDNLNVKDDLPILCFHSSSLPKDNIIYQNIIKNYNVYINNISTFNYEIKAIDVEKIENVIKLNIDDKAFLSANKIKLKSLKNNNIVFYNNSLLDECYLLYKKTLSKINFCPVWSKKELDYHMKYANISDSLIFLKENKPAGFINYRFVTIFRKNLHEKFAVIQWISDYKLNDNEKEILINECFAELKKQKCRAVLFQNIPLFRETSIHNYNFLSKFRKINFCCYSYKQNKELNDIKNSYEIII